MGIILPEIIYCRRYLEVNIAKSEATMLPFWAYECYASKNLEELLADDDEHVDKKAFERMIGVTLWCIQEEATLRFPMETVMLILERIIDVPIPPSPTPNSNSNHHTS